MFSHRKNFAFLGIVILIGMTAWWYWTGFDNPTKTSAMQSVEFPWAPSGAQRDHGTPGPSVVGNVDEAKSTTSRSLNWGLYSGTMQDQVQKALADRIGPMAADLAAKLLDCQINSGLLMFNSSLGGNSREDPAVQAIRNEQLREYQRQISACQAVAGDHAQVRLQLLNVAVEQRVFGAADARFQAGVLLPGGFPTPDVLSQLVHDATEGHLSSLFNVATYNPSVFGIDSETQAAVRYALKVASEDPIVGQRVVGRLKESEKIAPSWATEKSATYDYSKMSDAARKEGTAISARLIQQLTNPKS